MYFTSSNAAWEQAFTIEATDLSLDATYGGALLSNGKVALVTSFDTLDVQKTLITIDQKYVNGVYRPNIIESFNTSRLRVFSLVDEDVHVTPLSQALDIFSATFTASFSVKELASNTLVSVDTSMLAPKQCPFSTMQTVSIKIPSDYAGPAQLSIFHEVSCKESLSVPTFNNNVIYNEHIAQDRGLYVLIGSARTSDDPNKEVVTAACYMFDQGPGSVDNLGFNIFRTDPRRCYNKFRFNNVVPGSELKFHVITTTMTTADLESPLEEVKRISLTLASRGVTHALSAARLRADHVLSWQTAWKTLVNIVPKVGISAEHEASVASLNKSLRMAMYNIFSCTRENISIEVNPLNLSIVDIEGQTLYEGDIWLVPALLLIKPDVARAMLEFRWKTLSTAMHIAAGYGFTGGKFPYTDDSLGYSSTLVYDVMTPLHMFNGAIIAINTWNYYRVTSDKEWLTTKGYPILKAVADFFTSIIEVDEDGSYHIRNVVGLALKVSKDNHAFTNNAAKLALKYAIEASYELSLYVKEEWRKAFFGLPVLYVDDMFNFDVIKNDADTLPHDKFEILDMLLNIIPYYSQLFFCGDGRNGVPSIKKNIDYFTSRIDPAFADHPYNLAILAILHGLYAQHDPIHIASFQTYLDRFISAYTDEPWRSLRGAGSPQRSPNNLIMSAILVMIVAQGVSQLNIAGGVAETRFYYEEMRVKALISANMPNHWSHIRMTNIGREKKTFVTRNSLFYV